MKKLSFALAALALGAALSAQTLGAPTNPFSSNGAPDAVGAASTGRRAAPSWNSAPSSAAVQTLTGKVSVDRQSQVVLTVGNQQYVLLLPRNALASFGLKAGDPLTVEGQVLQARTGSSLILVSKVTAGGKSTTLQQPRVASRGDDFGGFGGDFGGRDRDRGDWGRDDRD